MKQNEIVLHKMSLEEEKEMREKADAIHLFNTYFENLSEEQIKEMREYHEREDEYLLNQFESEHC